MKKAFIISVSFLFLTATATLLYSKENGSVELTKKVGEVEAKKGSGSSWSAPKVNSSFIKGDILKTGLDSYAELALNADNRFRLKEESEVEMDKILEGTTDASGSLIKLVQFNLKSGSMLAKLDKLPQGVKLEVGSPTAVAGATGTEFAVTVESSGPTHVAVLESRVSVVSVGEPGKLVWVEPFQKVDVAPWEVALLSAKGTGILSEKILGKKFVQQSKEAIRLIGMGSGPDEATARLSALMNLNERVFDIEVAPEQKLGDILAADMEASQRVLELLSDAPTVKSSLLPDGFTEVEVEIAYTGLADAFGRPLPGVKQTIRPISLKEYGVQFGALARVTTRRAAQVDALRKLTEKIYGSVIDSQTTVKDLEATNDTIVTVVRGIVQGAEITGETYFSDGSVSVSVAAPGLKVKNSLTQAAGDIFGTNYMSSPTRIIVDDFEIYKEMEKI